MASAVCQARDTSTLRAWIVYIPLGPYSTKNSSVLRQLLARIGLGISITDATNALAHACHESIEYRRVVLVRSRRVGRTRVATILSGLDRRALPRERTSAVKKQCVVDI